MPPPSPRDTLIATASSPSPRLSQGEGRRQTPVSVQADAPHLNPKPLRAPLRFAERGDSRARVSDTRDPSGTIWHDRAFHRDAWLRVADGEDLPDAPAIVSKRRWLAERDALAYRNTPLGLVIDGGESLAEIVADLAHFLLIALAFPKFSDGRAFSTARLLREKFGYAGELRAVGNVLSDQIPLMRRVGFDTFEVTHAPTRRALAEGRISEVTLHYQPASSGEQPVGPRPWLRRSLGTQS
jgi:uncharacterized protein (DUF934 family)